MLVENTENRLIVIPVYQNGNNIKSLRLLPGVNQIKDDHWKLVEINVQDLIKVGFLKIITEKEPVKVEKKIGKKTVEIIEHVPVSFHDLKDKEARATVLSCFDIALLEDWLKIDERKAVRLVIEQQIKKINDFGKEEK